MTTVPRVNSLLSVVDVSDWAVDEFEPAGSDAKMWLATPDVCSRALFKPNRPHNGHEQGEDWAEKLTSELAALLGVPAARIDLAQRGDCRGCISYDVVPKGWELQPGAVLLSQIIGFDHDPRDPAARGHTLMNIQQALAGYGAPPGFQGPADFSAFDVFCGYLMLDALIANRDRHSENWAVLRGPNEPDQRLSPSYDHASALGFNLLDERRQLLFRDRNMMDAFLRKGTAHRFEDGKKATLVGCAHTALGMAGDSVRAYWLDRLTSTDEDQLDSVVARVPVMSDLSRRFARYLLTVNRGRLLDV
ncbi:MAG TPA: HipA domain-containing protein [Pseudonocardiaceae bacterium]|jgi:hypothetical protein